MATNTAFGTPTNLNQFSAIVNGANKNSLVSQLYGGKTSQTTPMVSTPNVVAASSQVKSPSQTSTFNGGSATPTNSFSALNTPTPSSASIFNGGKTVPTNAFGGQAPQAPVAPVAPTNLPVASHSVTDAQGNTTVQKYDTSAANTADTSGNTLNANANYNAGVAQTNTGPGTPVSPSAGNSAASYPGLISSLSGFNPFNNKNVSQPYNNAQELNTELQQSRTNEANSVAQNRLNPIPIGDQTGREAVIKNQYLDQQTALSQQLAGESNLYNSGLTGTGQQLSGLNAATGAAAPIQAPYSNQVLDPQTGQPLTGTGNTLNTAVQNAINQIKAGGGYSNAASSLSAFGPAGTNALLSALGPSFNINASDAEAAAQASNIGTSGTTQTNTASTGYAKATQDYNSLLASYNAADTQTKTLQNILASTGINATNSSDYNQTINTLQGRLGSSNYASFNTALQELQSMYSGLLSFGGGTPTSQEAQAISVLSPNSSASQINASIQQLQNAANAKLSAQQGLATTYQNALGGSTSSSSTSGNPGKSVSAGGYTFVQNGQGQWVAQ